MWQQEQQELDHPRLVSGCSGIADCSGNYTVYGSQEVRDKQARSTHYSHPNQEKIEKALCFHGTGRKYNKVVESSTEDSAANL